LWRKGGQLLPQATDVFTEASLRDDG